MMSSCPILKTWGQNYRVYPILCTATDYSEDYRETTRGTLVQLPVLCQNSEELRSCKATRGNQRSVFDDCFANTEYVECMKLWKTVVLDSADSKNWD